MPRYIQLPLPYLDPSLLPLRQTLGWRVRWCLQIAGPTGMHREQVAAVLRQTMEWGYAKFSRTRLLDLAAVVIIAEPRPVVSYAWAGDRLQVYVDPRDPKQMADIPWGIQQRLWARLPA